MGSQLSSQKYENFDVVQQKSQSQIVSEKILVKSQDRQRREKHVTLSE